MQTALAATWICFLFGLTFTAGNANRNETCQDPSGATYESANCDFSESMCEWRNTEGSQIIWERGSVYMSAPMSDARTNSVARLASPWFRATGNQKCTLQFWYYFAGDGNCQLSMYVDNDTSSMELFWQRDFQDIGPVMLPHSNCRHRIIFEAKKLRGSHRRYNYDQVYISNIEFRCSGPLTPTTAAGDRNVTTPSSLSPRVSPTGRTAASPSTTSDLSSSRAVGVVLSVVVVVVVVLVIVYCRITNRSGAICGKNLKLLNASSSAAPTQSERNGAGDGTNTDCSSHQNHNVDTGDASMDAGWGSHYYHNVDTVLAAPPLESRAGDNTHIAEDNYERMQPGASQTTDEPYEALRIYDNIAVMKVSRK